MIGGIKYLHVKAGHEAEFEEMIKTFTTEVRIREPGTLSFELFRNGAPGKYVILDRYKSNEALLTHCASSYGAIWFPRIRSVLQQVDVTYFPAHEPGADQYTALTLTRSSLDKAFRMASDIRLLPRWSTRFCKGIREDGGDFFVSSPQGEEVLFRYEIDEPGGVVWHCADTGTGELRTPMHFLPHGPGSMIMFTIKRPPALSDAAFIEQQHWADEEIEQLRELIDAP